MFGDYVLTRLVFQRALAFVYFIAFLVAANQIRPLVGARGLLPMRTFLRDLPFWEAPSLFWFHHSDGFLVTTAWVGVLLSMAALTGLSENFGYVYSILVWTLLWVLYQSFVNTGQTFYGFGWETLLLETGFLAIFLGPRHVAPPVIVIWLLRWLLFRVMFGAGMIKIRGDECWRDLTCLYYHYETQPIPNPLSWYFHYFPKAVHRAGVGFNHFVELVVPWFYFIPGPLAWIAGGLTILFQTTLIFSGNLSFLNYLTLVLCIPCFDDRVFRKLLDLPTVVPLPLAHKIAVGVLTAVVLFLSYRPARNLFSRRQMMNASFDPLHLVNTYGAFGSVGRERYEVVLEGTEDAVPTPASTWREYAFKAKPGDPARRPPWLSPYHRRLDWQIWFAAMSSYQYQPWLVNLVAKLLKNDADVLSLLGPNPFPTQPPKYIRGKLYRYRFTERGESGWWKRELTEEYLPALSLDNPSLQSLLKRMEWE